MKFVEIRKPQAQHMRTGDIILGSDATCSKSDTGLDSAWSVFVIANQTMKDVEIHVTYLYVGNHSGLSMNVYSSTPSHVFTTDDVESAYRIKNET